MGVGYIPIPEPGPEPPEKVGYIPEPVPEPPGKFGYIPEPIPEIPEFSRVYTRGFFMGF